MIPKHISENYFDFTWSKFGKPEISETTIRLPVSRFNVEKGYPGYPDETHYDQCVLVYEDVIGSERRLNEYHDEPEDIDGRLWYKIKSERTISDGPFAAFDDDVYLFTVEGVSLEPHAWLHWEIVARSVHIET